MAPNKRKMLEAARKHAQKGAKERSLKEYEALLKLDPRDAKLRLEVGDAHRRWGQLDEAAAAYRRVAEQYTDEGFDARAVAVYKQIQSLDPNGYSACEPLAELYQRMGLAAEAIAALQAAADGHARDGNKRHALDLLRRMVALDPTNTTSRIKVADLLRQEKLLEEAAAEYDAACAELEQQGETEAAGRVLERLLELSPDRADVLSRFARNLLARGRPDEAETPARRATEREPNEIPYHELLADVHRAQKRDDKLIEVYRRIAELYRLRGDDEHARDIMQRFVPMQAFEAPVRGEDSSPFGSEALEIDEPRTGSFDDEEFLDVAGPVTHRDVAPAAAPGVRPPPRAAAPPGPDATPVTPVSSVEETVLELGAEEGSRILGDPEALLAEARVYLRYGKRRQAIENLQAILAREPHHRGALEKLGDAYADDGDAAGAVAAWLRAGELARDAGDVDAVAVLRDRVGALDAAAAATLEAEDAGDVVDESLGLPDESLDDVELPELTGPVEDPPEDIEIDLDGGVGVEEPLPAPVAKSALDPTATASGDPGHEIDIELDLDDAGLSLTADDADALSVDGDVDASEEPAERAAEAPPSDPGDRSDPEPIADPDRVAEDLEEAEFYLQQGLSDEARALFERVLAASPGHPLALVRLGELAAAAGEDPDAPGIDAEARDRSASPAAVPPPRAVAEETEPDAQRGWLAGDDDPFLDEPPEGADEGESSDADASHGSDALADASDEPHPVAIASDEPDPVAVASGDFDLAAELSAALEDVVPEGGNAGATGDEGFHEVFGAFKRGVEATLGSGDHDAHYDLGIAYREMGLLTDAIAEFRSAMQAPERRIDCLHMLGLCALEQGSADEAIDLLAHALGTPDLAQEQALAIRFELGRAYEQSGDSEKARAAWEKVASVDPDFCEVSELLAGLSTAGPPPAAGLETSRGRIAEEEAVPAPEAAGDHESFDDLLEEARAELDPESSGPAAPSDDAGAGGPPEARPKRRRRKISFV